MLEDFTYLKPKTLEEALALLEEWGAGAKILAGGTDIFPKIMRGQPTPACLIDIKGIGELKGCWVPPGEGLQIGSATPLQALADWCAGNSRYAFLRDTVRQMASLQIRNRASVGGNLCNAAPSADLAAPLMVAGSTVKLVGSGRERRVALEGFFKGPGQTTLKPDEILHSIWVPRPADNTAIHYQKLRRTSVDIALVGVACRLGAPDKTGQRPVRLALASVGPAPLRATKAEAYLSSHPLDDKTIGEGTRLASLECTPIGDVRSSLAYRREMVRALTEKAIKTCLEKVLE